MPGRTLLLAGFLICITQSGSAQEAREVGPAFKVLGQAFVALQVPDDKVSASWYQRVLRLEEVKHLAADDGRFSIRILTGAGLTVELIRSNSATEATGTHRGIFKVGFYVDDIEAAFSWLKSQGVDTDQRIFTDEALGVSSFVFRDLHGNRLQVFSKLDR